MHFINVLFVPILYLHASEVSKVQTKEAIGQTKGSVKTTEIYP